MRGIVESFLLDGKQCHIYFPPDRRPNQLCDAVYVLDGAEFSERLEQIEAFLNTKDCRAFCLVYFSPVDWNRDYSPWPAPAVFQKGEPFSGGAGQTLSFLTGRLLEKVQRSFPVLDTPEHRGIMGYSLGGLCALWSMYECREFGYGICCSPSLWYDGWTEYVKQNTLPKHCGIYLSLGQAEEKTRNRRLAVIGERAREMDTLLQQDERVGRHTLVFHEGGHFHDVPKRLALGLQWALEMEK